MTHLDFVCTSFGKGDKAKYKNEVYLIAQVDFEEELFGLQLDESNPENISWIRCENVEFIPYTD